MKMKRFAQLFGVIVACLFLPTETGFPILEASRNQAK